MSERWRIKQPPSGAPIEVTQTAETSVLRIVEAPGRRLGVRWLERVDVGSGWAVVVSRGVTGLREHRLDADAVRAVEGRPRADDAAYDLSFHSGPGRRVRVRLPLSKRHGAWVRGELERWALLGGPS